MNPFRNTIVIDPWDAAEIDVQEINAAAFRLCIEALESVRHEKRSTSVLLHGEPGSGKTHLLNRIRAHVKTQTQLHLFVSVRLQSSPHRFWRYLRSCLIDNLIKPDKKGKTQLERLIGVRLYRTYRKTRVTDLDEYRKILASLFVKSNPSSNLCRALELMVRRKHLLDAISWLKGESLPESSMKKLDLVQEAETEADPEDHAREFVLGIMNLAGPSIPVVFCFDQVEALQRYKQGDIDSLYKFGQAIGTLHDKSRNMLLVSCIQSFFLDVLKTAIMSSDYDRLAARTQTLNPLNVDQAIDLASARLKAFKATRREKTAVLLKTLKSDLREFVGTRGEVARKVLSRCANSFDSWQLETPIIDTVRTIDEFLVEEKEVRTEKALEAYSPEKTDDVFQGSVPVVLNVMDERWTEEDKDRPMDMDIVLKGPNRRIGISLCNQKNMVSLAGRFRRLLKQLPDSKLDRLILVRHPNLPISKNAKKTRHYLEILQAQKALFIQPDTELMATLEALRTLFADAKSGDLANADETLGDGVVREWLKRNLDGQLLNFMEDLTGPLENLGTEEESRILQDLIEFIHQHKIAPVNEAAKELETTPDKVVSVLLRHSGKMVYLEGPPPVFYEFIPERVEFE